MLRRRSLKTDSDLERRKSTSSAHGVVLGHLDPALAQRDAHIAACEAYARAQNRNMAEDMSLFPPTAESAPCRRLSERSRRNPYEPSTPDPRGSNVQGLCHRQSVRFVGPCSVQMESRGGREAGFGSSSTEKDPDSRKPDDGDGRDRSQQTMPDFDDTKSNAEAPRHPQRAPPLVPLPSVAAGYIEALAAGEEYYTPEDDIASAPSSYRRLHRSKSMHTNAQGARRSHEYSGPSPYGPRSRPALPSNSRRLFRSDPYDRASPHDTPALRAPKSMSFLGSRNSRFRSDSVQKDVVRDATHAGLPGPPESELPEGGRSNAGQKYMTSALFNSRGRRTGTKLRESLRSSSPTEGHDLPNSNTETSPDIHGTLRSKARKASKSLKFKLKNLFTHSARSEAETSIPQQHIEAQRTHVNQAGASIHGPIPDYEFSVEEDHGSIHKVSAKIPSVRFPPSGLVHSSKASLESLRDEAERKVSDVSSLTSWAHSGPSTLTSQQQQQWREWEKQRLSVIGGAGTYAPSPSMWREPLGTGLFECPEDVNKNAAAARPIVDSQRVYSALMKRMRAINSHGKQAGEEQSADSDPDHSASTMEPADRSLNRTPDTIRHSTLRREYSTASDTLVTPTRAPKRTGSTRSRLSQSTTDLTGTARYHQDGTGQSVRDRRWTPTQLYPAPSVAEATNPDTQPRVPGSPSSHTFRTASPFRRALRKSMLEEQNAWAQQSSGTEQDSDTGTQVHRLRGTDSLPETGSGSNKDLDYSESIYSTDDFEWGPGPAVRSNEQSIDANTPVPYRADGCRNSTASSIDWKTWLSANIGKFDPSLSPSKLSDPDSVRPAMPPSLPNSHSTRGGHVRESAQIHADDEDDHRHHNTINAADGIFQKPTTPKPSTPSVAFPTTTPLSEVEHNVLAREALSPALRRSVKRIAPRILGANNSPSGTKTPTTTTAKGLLVENKAPSGGAAVGGRGRMRDRMGTGSPPPPPIPARSKLRPEPLRVVRSSMLRGSAVGAGVGGGGGGDGGESPAGRGCAGGGCAESVTSSPGLTEALRRQFGGLDGVLSGDRGGAGGGSWSVYGGIGGRVDEERRAFL